VALYTGSAVRAHLGVTSADRRQLITVIYLLIT
jgi:hypothetical protein